jgi:3-(3-hydroxy-phenyl)propionate hydroxylase
MPFEGDTKMSPHIYLQYTHYPVKRAPELDGTQATHPVVIAGGGPVGLTLALGLAKRGVRAVVIEPRDCASEGSRATCISRRSLELFRQLGCDPQFNEVGLDWVGGRTYFRDKQVLYFTMPTFAGQQFPPMINLQQCLAEQYLLDEAVQHPLIDIRWKSSVSALSQDDEGLSITIESHAGNYALNAQWLVACDGAHSPVRKMMGLAYRGVQYERRYVIADLRLNSDYPTERRVWFDPPSNPGSTIIMHKQPQNIWRIDYQLLPHENAEEEAKRENVARRVKQHLDWIGEPPGWEIVWNSLYKANSLSLESYRHQRVMFAGDAAHLVPIFGVRGLNGGIDDAGNLAWKLAAVVDGEATDALLDSYSNERVLAAHANISEANKSTWFMSPPSRGYEVMRDAALSLSVSDPRFSVLINPRQTQPIEYLGSALSSVDDSGFAGGVRPGLPLASVAVKVLDAAGTRDSYLMDVLGLGFSVIAASPATGPKHLVDGLLQAMPEARVISVVRDAEQTSAAHVTLLDADGSLARILDMQPGSVMLMRPDFYVAARWRAFDAAALKGALARALGAAS